MIVMRRNMGSGRQAGRIGRAALLAVAAASVAMSSEHGAMAQDGFGNGSGGGSGRDGGWHWGGGEQEHSWPFWGGNLENTHSAIEEGKINVANASTLKQKWVFETAGDVTVTPTVSGGSVYVPDWGGYVYRIDAATGKAIWSHKVSEYTGNAKSYTRNSPAIGPEQIVFGDQAGGVEMAVDKGTGKLLWKTTLDSSIGAAITNSAVIVGDRVYVGVASLQEGWALVPGFKLTFRGSVAALDLRTGKVLWQTYTVPPGYTGGAVWGSNFAVDERRQSLFVTSGNNYSVPASVASCLSKAGTNATAKLACLDPADYLDAMLSLDLNTGAVKWAHRLEGADTWTVSCIVNGTGGVPCPTPSGPDYDFGSGPNMIRMEVNGRRVEAIGAGQKSGVYWSLDPDTGTVNWGTQVGPGGDLGGIEWGTATDGKRVYAEIDNASDAPFLLQPAKTETWNAGSWAAMDAATGAMLWQVPVTGQNPIKPTKPANAVGAVTVANGVFYGGSLSGDMVALDAATGKLLWKFASGGSVICGPSIVDVDGTIFWGSGYRNPQIGIGTGNNKLYAFSVAAGSTPSTGGGWENH